jgi:tetratricopeptide (TPR) repeat protein
MNLKITCASLALSLLFALPLTGFGQKDEAEILLKKAQEKIGNGDYTGAITDLNQAEQKDPKNLTVNLKRAFCYSQTGNYQGAIDDLTKVINAKPDEEFAIVSRGSAKNKLKKFKEALVDFDLAIKLKPDDYDAYNNRGWAKKGLGDEDGACKDWHYSKKKGNGEAKIILSNNRCK